MFSDHFVQSGNRNLVCVGQMSQLVEIISDAFLLQNHLIQTGNDKDLLAQAALDYILRNGQIRFQRLPFYGFMCLFIDTDVYVFILHFVVPPLIICASRGLKSWKVGSGCRPTSCGCVHNRDACLLRDALSSSSAVPRRGFHLFFPFFLGNGFAVLVAEKEN
jgi:hypothetical protein